MLLILVFFFSQLLTFGGEAKASSFVPEFPPCDPISELLAPTISGQPTPQFCAKWNPEFSSNGGQCCGKPMRGSRKKKWNRCSPKRAKGSYCSEMTVQQREYFDAAVSGKLGDLLNLLTQEMGRKGDQAYCTSGTGFLAYGRQVIPTIKNRIIVQSPEKCLNFGTDPMVGMLEWLGRQISTQYSSPVYSGVHMILGDISAPRGGCLSNPSGKRRHASHTAGQDADVGFITARQGQDSPTRFHTQFDPKTNWWFLKKVFQNPFACIKVVFLDKRHIRTLAKYAKADREWQQYHRFVRHMPGHKHHFHIRVGIGPGQAGCTPNARPELEQEEDVEAIEATEQSILDELKSRQGPSVEE